MNACPPRLAKRAVFAREVASHILPARGAPAVRRRLRVSTLIGGARPPCRDQRPSAESLLCVLRARVTRTLLWDLAPE